MPCGLIARWCIIWFMTCCSEWGCLLCFIFCCMKWVLVCLYWVWGLHYTIPYHLCHFCWETFSWDHYRPFYLVLGHFTLVCLLHGLHSGHNFMGIQCLGPICDQSPFCWLKSLKNMMMMMMMMMIEGSKTGYTCNPYVCGPVQGVWHCGQGPLVEDTIGGTPSGPTWGHAVTVIV
jgi:hypothetical protein